jgi:hypothetical protein
MVVTADTIHSWEEKRCRKAILMTKNYHNIRSNHTITDFEPRTTPHPLRSDLEPENPWIKRKQRIEGTTAQKIVDLGISILHGGWCGWLKTVIRVIFREIQIAVVRMSSNIVDSGGKQSPGYIWQIPVPANFSSCRCSGSSLTSTNSNSGGAVLKERIVRWATKRWKDFKVAIWKTS